MQRIPTKLDHTLYPCMQKVSTNSHTHTKAKQSFLAAKEWSRAPGHLCTKQAHRAGAVQPPGARARSTDSCELLTPTAGMGTL